MRRAYATALQIQNVVRRLDATDHRIIDAVATARLLTAKQLDRLLGETTLSDVRRHRRQLRRLVELDVLARLDRTIGGRAAGSAGFVYQLGMVSQRLRHPELSRRRPWTPQPAFLTHGLLVSELYVQLIEANRDQSNAQLLEFQAEPACWRSFSAMFGGSLTLKPDAFVRLGIGDWVDESFIEIDRSTESPSTLRRKLDAYAAYFASGRSQRSSSLFPRIIWAVPDERRRRVVLDAIADAPAETWKLHRVLCFDDVVSSLVEEPP